jgi:UDP-glucose 4-epimerase
VVGEKIARSFASRTGADIYALRIGVVIEPQDYECFQSKAADPRSRRRDAWSYIDVRDLAQIVHLCLEKDGLGFQVFNATNDDIIANEPTMAFLAKHAPNTAITRELVGFEAPMSNRKARELLGFREEHNWRKYAPGLGRSTEPRENSCSRTGTMISRDSVSP